MMIRCSICS
ncbi:hypothetical protein DW657_06195 [Prevotella sp. AM23-5]|nr:hypothetical protein DW657_06195 [Prevotella sp. AM23-5]